MKFHLICQEESANVKKLLGNKKKSWEMWRKALSNYSVYLGSSWWNIYITVMEVLRVIKLVRWVSSLFPRFSGLFTEEKTKMWTKPLFLMMELLSRATASRLSEYYFIAYEVNATFTLLNSNVCFRPNLWQCRISFTKPTLASQTCETAVHLYAAFPFGMLILSENVKLVHSAHLLTLKIKGIK